MRSLPSSVLLIVSGLLVLMAAVSSPSFAQGVYLNEINFLGVRTERTNNLYIDYAGDYFAAEDTNLEIFNSSLGWTFRPEGRFMNPDIPFFLIPYNFRSPLGLRHSR